MYYFISMSTMGQERLNGLALMTIKNDLLDELEHEDLLDEFASNNIRRIELFR